jgi:hypothetical protein
VDNFTLKMKTFYAIWSVYADQVSLETNEAYAARLDEMEREWDEGRDESEPGVLYAEQ